MVPSDKRARNSKEQVSCPFGLHGFGAERVLGDLSGCAVTCLPQAGFWSTVTRLVANVLVEGTGEAGGERAMS